MKKFIKRIPEQIAATFSIVMIVFITVSYLKGVNTIAIHRLIELFMLSVIGGIWMEFAFGKYVIKKMTDIKRALIFIVPFAVTTFLFAVLFQWITKLNLISTYVKFIGIFVICWIVSIILFEIEHSIKGKQYTQKLREYQNGGSSDEQ